MPFRLKLVYFKSEQTTLLLQNTHAPTPFLMKAYHSLLMKTVFSCLLIFLTGGTVFAYDFPFQTTVPTRVQLWGLDMIGLKNAENSGFQGNGIVVGIVDDIIHIEHPEIADRVVGTVNIYGTPYIPGETDYHGTHVAGTAVGSNVGVASGATMVGINVISGLQDKSGNVDIGKFNNHVVAGYRYGLDCGVRVFNNSWGLGGYISEFTKEKFASEFGGLLEAFRTTSAAGAIQVFSAGNDGEPWPHVQGGLPHLFPDLQPYWINVVAVGPDRTLAWYSDKADVAAEWSIAAPGGAGDYHGFEDFGTDKVIWSAYRGSVYTSLFGTSMAAPHVTGGVAVTYEIFPEAASTDIVQMVLQTATDIGEPGVDAVYGWGLLNLGNIVSTIEPRTAGLFANAAWSRFVTMDEMGTALRGRMASPVIDLSGAGGESSVSVGSGNGTGGIASLSNAKGAGLWVLPIYAESSIDPGTASQSAHLATSGAWVGSDVIAREDARVGIAAGYSRSDMKTSTSLDGGRTDAMHFGLYATREWDGWVLEGSGQMALMDQYLSRNEISGAAGTSRSPVGHSSFRTDGLEAAISFARRLEHASGWSIAPYASLKWRWQKSDAFHEADAQVFSLSVTRNTLYQLEPGVGLSWTSAASQAGAGSWWVASKVGYSRLSGDIDHAFQVSLLGRPILGETAELGRDILTFGAQLHMATLSRGASGFLGYRGKLQDNAREHVFMAGVDVKF